MGSIILYWEVPHSVPRLMIKIWEFSEHVHKNPPSDLSCCDCRHCLDICIDAAHVSWDNEFFFFFFDTYE